MRCNTCGTSNPDNAAFCTNCGSALPKTQRKIFCASCGKELGLDEAFCPLCGAKNSYMHSAVRSVPPAKPQPLPSSCKIILRRTSVRRLINGILTLILSILQIFWPFAAFYGETDCVYSLAFEGIILILLVPAFIFFLINFIGGLRCIVTAARMNSRPVDLLSTAHSGGSIILIIFYSIMVIVSLFTLDVFGVMTFIFGIIVCSLRLGLDVKFIRNHKKELTIVEEHYLASLR